MKQVLITLLFLTGVSTSVHAQDAYQGYLAYKKAEISSLSAKRSSLDKESQKEIDVKLAALDYSPDGKPIANTLEVQIAKARSYKAYYISIGDLATAQKYELAITNMSQSQPIELEPSIEKTEK